MLNTILSFLGGGVLKQITGPLLEAYNRKLEAENSADKLEAEKDIARLEAYASIAQIEAGRAWSATSVGRWLIVVPFGIWWAAIFLIQIINPWFGVNLVVIAIPDNIMEMAKILVPAIVIADAGAFAAKQIGRR
jgi:hypothetical protein